MVHLCDEILSSYLEFYSQYLVIIKYICNLICVLTEAIYSSSHSFTKHLWLFYCIDSSVSI